MPHERHQQLLFQGVLTGLVGQFEVLLSDIAHMFYVRAPNALESTEKVFSIDDLRRFGSIEDAVELTIEKRIDDLLRGSAEDWRKFFQNRLKLDLAEFAQSWGRVEEFIQRRHIFVHAGGKISRRYLANVEDEIAQLFFDSPQIGDFARLNEVYVAEAPDAFESMGLGWGFAAWCKLFPQEVTAAADLLLDLLYDRVLAGNWEVVDQLARWGADHGEFSASVRTTAQMNLWLSMKKTGREEAVFEEMDEYDFSALEPRFVIAAFGLREDIDGFSKFIVQHQGAGLEAKAWDQWPILEPLRKDERFSELRERFGPKARSSGGSSAAKGSGM